MIKFEEVEVVGWRHAIRGMRNALESWDRSDSYFDGSYCEEVCLHKNEDCNPENPYFENGVIGSNDLDLMMRLRNAGPDHRKFMRMIVVYVDITAPLYWWKEADTYKVGTVANSCSTMHKIHAKEFTMEDFSYEHLLDLIEVSHGEEGFSAISIDGYGFHYSPKYFIHMTCDMLNNYRNLYLETKDKKYWWQMIQLLPSSYNQKRTVMLNYEVLMNMYHSRQNHKLDEWSVGFVEWVKTLPYSELITGGEI